MEENQQQQQPQIIITKSPKNMGIALILSILFGPLGLLYATVKGGIIMMIVGAIVGILTLGLGAIIIWPIAIIWSYTATKKYNNELMKGHQ